MNLKKSKGTFQHICDLQYTANISSVDLAENDLPCWFLGVEISAWGEKAQSVHGEEEDKTPRCQISQFNTNYLSGIKMEK